jgi:hypothetical protein
MGICVLVAAFGFLIHCVFGSFMASEWGYWLVALLVRYGEVYQVADTSVATAAPTFPTQRIPEAAA